MRSHIICSYAYLVEGMLVSEVTDGGGGIRLTSDGIDTGSVTTAGSSLSPAIILLICCLCSSVSL